jgi:hypothetical protein
MAGGGLAGADWGVLDAGWGLAGRRASNGDPPESRAQGQGVVSGLFLEAQKHQFHIETVTITTE